MSRWKLFRTAEWNPFRPVPEQSVPVRRRVLGRLVRCWRRLTGARARNRLLARRLPAVHASEDEDAYVIRADLPRWIADRVEVTLEPGVVNLRAEAHTVWKCRSGTPLQLERSSDFFERAFRLPQDADLARASAELRNGHLCVRLPRQTGVRVVPVAVKAENMASLGLRDAAP